MTDSFPIPFGRYQLEERLAVGGMAELFRARSLSGSPPGDLAIKRLLPHLAVDSYYREMFTDEAKLTSQMRHDNIIRTYDYGVHEDQLYMVMELVDGLDGLSILRECAHRKVRMPPELAVYVTHEVLSALAFAHEQVDDQGQPLGVVHRDISPANVLFSRTGEVKLADFGIAHAARQSHRTKDGTLKGKYGYMSPEQVSGEPIDGRSDVFSAAVLMTEMLMGRRLFAAPSELDVLLMVRDVRLDRLDRYGEHIGMDLDRIVRKALRREVDERFATASWFRDSLGEWLFMHEHDVGAADIEELVAMLYDDAWQRKRERTARLAEEMASRTTGTAMTMPDLASAGLRQAIDGISIGRISVSSRTQGDGVVAGMVGDASEPSVPIPLDGALDGVLDRDPTLPAPVGGPSSANMSEDRSAPAMVLPRSIVAPGTLSDSEIQLLLDHLAPEPPGQATFGEGASSDSRTSGPRLALVTSRDPLLSPSVDFDDSEISEVRTPLPVVRGHSTVAEEVIEFRSAGLGVKARAPDETGAFFGGSAIGLFYRLALWRATGVLVAERDDVCKEIFLRRGVPEYVVSNVPSELFGAYLVERKAITEGELSMALAMQPHFGNKLGETLVGIGLLQSLDVFRYLNHQLRDKVVDVCTWDQGQYRWYKGMENSQPPFPLALNAYEVLGRCVRNLDESRLFHWLDEVSSMSPRPVGEPEVSLEIFGLGRSVRKVYRQLDGSRTVAELRALLGKNNEKTGWLRILYLLVHTGLVDM